MSLLPAEKLVLALHLTIGLLLIPLLTEGDKIRLVGPSRCSGTVEVSHEDSWGTVCDDIWNLNNAAVVCREVNCGSALEAKNDAFFGKGNGTIWLDDVQCMGHESSILKCQHRPFGQSNCGHVEDAGVVCSETLRVVNGSNRCNGRVEVLHNERWRRVCGSDWGKEEAEILCRELNCGSPGHAAAAQTFGEARDLPGVKTNCFGNESSFSQCKLQEFNESCIDATAFCTNSKPVRLKNGTHRCSGRVEVYHDGQWGTVCDDKWGMQEAAVVCRQMNCGNPVAVEHKAHFGKGQNQVWLDDIDCIGHEKSLTDCPHRGLGQHDCDHSEDAGVICSENVRLVDGPDSCSGRLEVFNNDTWGRICSNNWSSKEAAMVCKELNCGTPKKTQENFGAGSSELGSYTSTCSDSVSSIAQCTLQQHSGTCDSVSVSCGAFSSLRLVNGTDRCSGRVEILHDGQWGTVCDDDFDMRDAQVVCRTMDCGSPQTIKHRAFFGEGEGEIWLDDVNCAGNETSLVHCQRPSFGENNCGHGEDVGVICSATIRLLNGTDHCSGRVEVHYNGHWSPAYNVNWGMNEARVVCREMNCGDPVQAAGSFVGSGDLRGYKISCGGGESSLTQCTVRDYVRTSSDRIQEATVQCSGNVKLSNGPTRCAGTVELYDKGQWGTLCADTWDMSDAAVVCRQLDCGKVHKISTNYESGQRTEQTWVEQIKCNGLEVALSQCPQRPLQDRTCNTTSLASVVCTENLEVRLVNGQNDCSGRVEVRHGTDWKTVCDTDWTMKKAEVVCELLECGHAVNAPGAAAFGQGSGPAVDTKDSCFDNVTALQQCSVKGFTAGTCGHEHDASVLCTAQLRLVSSLSQCAGRVEILHKGEWGTVCDDNWEISNAKVVCKQLGCGLAVSAPTSAHFGKGTGPIWLDNVECSGQEAALTHCKHPGFGENNCGHGEDAGVICFGSLEKPQITLSPGPEVNWGDRVEITCTIVTEHLGGTFVLRKTQDSTKLEKLSEHKAATFTFPKVDFNHTGSYFCEYHEKLPNQVFYLRGSTVDLSVTVKLKKPSISLTSPQAMVIYSADKISVTQGSNFSITCLTPSKYAEGIFHLMKSDKETSETQPGFTDDYFNCFSQANFDFATIGYEHQGEYTCVYSVNISSSPVCSAPSKTLQVTVQAPSSSAVGGVVGGLVVLLVVLVIGYLVWRNRWRAAGATVQFRNRFRAAIKPNLEDRSNGALDGRERNMQINKYVVNSRSKEAKDQDAGDTGESVPEDLDWRVCYELEPLVHTGPK